MKLWLVYNADGIEKKLMNVKNDKLLTVYSSTGSTSSAGLSSTVSATSSVFSTSSSCSSWMGNWRGSLDYKTNFQWYEFHNYATNETNSLSADHMIKSNISIEWYQNNG